MKALIAPKKTTVPTETKRDIAKLFRVLCSCDRCKFFIFPVSVIKKAKHQLFKQNNFIKAYILRLFQYLLFMDKAQIVRIMRK